MNKTVQWKFLLRRIQLLVGGPGVQAAILLLPHHHLCPRMHARHCLLGLYSHYLSDFQNDQIIVGTKVKPIQTCWSNITTITANHHQLLISITHDWGCRWTSGSTRRLCRRGWLSGSPPSSPCPLRSQLINVHSMSTQVRFDRLVNCQLFLRP